MNLHYYLYGSHDTCDAKSPLDFVVSAQSNEKGAKGVVK